MILAEFAPLGLDSTWWGTIVALLIALGGAFFPAIVRKRKRPALSITYSRIEEFSSSDELYYWIRVPISNAVGKNEAKNVEVFLEEFLQESENGFQRRKGLVPMRIKWCHGEAPSCPSIPAGSFRLLHLGCVDLKTRFSEDGEIQFPSLTIGGEVHIAAHAPIARGTFHLTLTISAEDAVTTQHRLSITLRPANDRNALPAVVRKLTHVLD